VIDEGAMFTHTDLAGQIWTNPFDRVDGIDNDGNGFIDDIHGWDFENNDNTTFDGRDDDHGTHVSGTIGAKGGNGTGVAGVNWKITIITAKFLGSSGGTTANAIKAIDYITDLKTRHGLLLPATNNSWGGGGFSQALKSAIDRANAANILFVAAAGNGGFDGVGDNNDVTPSFPASYTSANIISVAAITITGAMSSFSNFGATSVDIGAPGSAIISTVPSNNLFPSSTYATFSGTSMATPHVTGGAALFAATHPTASAAAIKQAILSSAVPTSSLSGKCVTGGRLTSRRLLINKNKSFYGAPHILRGFFSGFNGCETLVCFLIVLIKVVRFSFFTSSKSVSIFFLSMGSFVMEAPIFRMNLSNPVNFLFIILPLKKKTSLLLSKSAGIFLLRISLSFSTSDAGVPQTMKRNIFLLANMFPVSPYPFRNQ
jgi:hypothetical protein